MYVVLQWCVDHSSFLPNTVQNIELHMEYRYILHDLFTLSQQGDDEKREEKKTSTTTNQINVRYA